LDTYLASLLCADENTELESTEDETMADYMKAARSPLDEYADPDTMRNTLRKHLLRTHRIEEFHDGTADLRDHMLVTALGYNSSSTSASNKAIGRDFVVTATEVHECQQRERRGARYGSQACPYHGGEKEEASIHRGCVQLETNRHRERKPAMIINGGVPRGTLVNFTPTSALKVTLLGVANMGSCETELLEDDKMIRCRGLRTARIDRTRNYYGHSLSHTYTYAHAHIHTHTHTHTHTQLI